MQKDFKCVLFDLDGTLLDTEKMNIIPLQRLIKEEFNLDIPYTDLLKYRAFSGIKVLELLGFTDIKTSYAKWVKYVNQYEQGATLFDGWDIVIKTLSANGIICGIVSSKLKAQYEIDFIPTGLHTYMKSIILADDSENHKPHPEPLLKALELVDINPADSIYVGDTIADYKAAKEAGMTFALTAWSAFDLNGIYADIILNHPIDLLKSLN